MKRQNRMEKIHTHKILNHPILALILLPIWCSVLASLGGGLIDRIFMGLIPGYVGGLGIAAMGLICLMIHKRWFRGEFDGSLKLKHFGEAMILLLPVVAFVVLNLQEVDLRTVTPSMVLTAFCLGVAPGLSEEVAFRGLAGANFMRIWKDEKKIVPAALLTAAVFGLVHLANIFAGAGITISIAQAVYAFGIGILFAAVYFRTGSLLPTVLLHTLVDAAAFMNAELVETGGVLLDNGPSPELVFTAAAGLLLGTIGLWYLRPAKRGEILRLWAEKWTLPETEAAPEAEAAAD